MNKKYNYNTYYVNNYINENNIDIINNILKKAILSYKFYNENLIKTDDECIKMIYSSSAQLQGWYNFYFSILNKYFLKIGNINLKKIINLLIILILIIIIK